MYCAVCGCNNCDKKGVKKEGVSFYTFPKDPEVLKRWIHFCKRKDVFNVKTSRICSEHFLAEDFERNLQLEMGFMKRKCLFLKPGAVPSVLSPTGTDIRSESDRTTRTKARETKKEIDVLLNHAISEVEEEVHVEPDEQISPFEDYNIIKSKNTEYLTEIKRLQEQIIQFKKNETILNTRIKSLETKLTKSKCEAKNLEQKLASIFTYGQIRKLKNGSKLLKWSEVDIARSITLYSASAKAYKLLRKKEFPLPSVRTLQRWAQKVQISEGILQPVIRILKAATQLDEAQKVCVLSFDEMKVKKAYCYDKPSDTTLAPANYVQLAMLRGLMSNWKQPIFYDFDCKMTVSILQQILSTAEDSGYTIVAMVSDLGGSNRALYSELGITPENPRFSHGGQNIYVFADVPHLMKLTRNHFIDSGFVINQKIVKKDVIEKLLASTSTELSITHKINESYINVRGADRQKVKLATKLFSHTIAKAIQRAAALNLVGNDWEECYSLFTLVDEWFDVMNVRVPKSDSRERKHAYGLALDVQEPILSRMTNLVMKMRVVGKNTLLPFQKGIIQSNNAVKLLFDDLKSHFGFKYVLTYRLNQDVLENTFGLLRAKGGLHDHPDRQEFKYRLRSHILGHNEGVISDSANVGSDDTPDLVSPLTGNIFKSIAWEPEEEVCQEQQELNIMAFDGLENLAGYICHKLPDLTSGLQTAKERDSSSWVSHVSEGGLTRPSSEMMLHMAALESIFNSFNGQELVICNNYLQNLLDLAQTIQCEEKVKKLFFRARMYFRIRTLNREISLEINSKKRKLNKTIN